MKNFLLTLKTLSAGLLGAAVTSGAMAATQYISTSGATQDWPVVGSAAAAGALTGAVAYLVKSPLKP